jgi:hypothetical protein
VKAVQSNVMKSSSHVQPAGTNSLGHPSDAGSWTARNHFEYIAVGHDSVGGTYHFPSDFGAHC